VIVRDLRPLCGTWRTGELAVCIRDDWADKFPYNPRKGDVLRVAGIVEGVRRGIKVIALAFEGKPDVAWAGYMFRKAVSDDEAADEAFVERIKRHARTPQLENA